MRAHLLTDMTAERPGEDELVREHVHPALTRIQDRLAQGVAVDTVVEIGKDASALAGADRDRAALQADRLRRAPARAVRAATRSCAAADLLYVLDSPEVADNLLDSAHALSALHGVPFRVVADEPQRRLLGGQQRRRLGRAGQPRRAAELRRDPRPAGLARQDVARSTTPRPDIGALGPKLLYEDDSIQHAGLYFYRDPGARVWGNQHYFKGMHRSFPAANVARPCPP